METSTACARSGNQRTLLCDLGQVSPFSGLPLLDSVMEGLMPEVPWGHQRWFY
jgi:hypothetical protein